MADEQFQPLKILSFGAGAIGTYIGGSLALAGHELVFLEQPKVVEELRRRGLRLDLSMDKRRNRTSPSFVRPQAFDSTDSIEEALEHGPFEVALFALKSFDTASFLEGLKPYTDRLPVLLCLSNGIENEPAIAGALGPEKVIAGTVTSAIGRHAAGDIVLEKLRGMGVAAGHPLSEKIAGALEAAYLNCRLYPDARDMKWSKLLTNLIANPASAILDMTPAQILAHKCLFEVEIKMLRECLSVMRAQGIKVVDLPGTPVRALTLATQLPLWISRPILMRSAGTGRGAKMPSFHIDLYSGRGKSEVEYLHGAVVKAGEAAGIPTPVNRSLTEILSGLTKGAIPLEEYAHQPDKLVKEIHL